MPETKIRFAPNVPQELIFKAEGEYLPETEQVRYELADGRILYLDSSIAAKLNYLEIAPLEKVIICKRWNGTKKPGPIWDVSLSPETEKIRAMFQSPGAKFSCAMPEPTYMPPLTQVVPAPEDIDVIPELGYTKESAELVGDLKIIELQKLAAAARKPESQIPVPVVAPTELPAQEVLATGTNGPQRMRKLVPIPTKIPMDRAFVEVVRIVRDGLAATGEQWGDGAKQDAVSTILISAAKQGWITIWERSVEA